MSLNWATNELLRAIANSENCVVTGCLVKAPFNSSLNACVQIQVMTRPSRYVEPRLNYCRDQHVLKMQRSTNRLTTPDSKARLHHLQAFELIPDGVWHVNFIAYVRNVTVLLLLVSWIGVQPRQRVRNDKIYTVLLCILDDVKSTIQYRPTHIWSWWRLADKVVKCYQCN